MNSLFEREGIGSNISLMLHHATRNVHGAREFQPCSTQEEPLAWVAPTLRLAQAGPRIDLRPHLADADIERQPPIAKALMGRYSTRAYSRQALTIAEVARFWHWAYPAQGQPDRSHPHYAVQPWNGHVTLVRPVMLALRVDGLEPGAYHVDEKDLSLLRLDADASQISQLLDTACFQEEFKSAAALILMVGSLATALQRYGDRGYRYMLLENGVQLQRNSIACGALGLVGCITGSFCQDRWDQWLGLDGFHGSVLNGYAMGHNEGPKMLATAVAQAEQGRDDANT